MIPEDFIFIDNMKMSLNIMRKSKVNKNNKGTPFPFELDHHLSFNSDFKYKRDKEVMYHMNYSIKSYPFYEVGNTQKTYT